MCQAQDVILALRHHSGATQDLAGEMPAALAAYGLYAGDTHDKHVLEARLLAGSPPREIAAKTGITEEAVTLYEKWYFDVADRRDARGYVTHQILRLHPNPEPTLSNVLKSFGYLGGPLVLDSVLRTLGLWHYSDDQECQLWQPEIVLEAITTFLVPLNNRTASSVQRLELQSRLLTSKGYIGVEFARRCLPKILRCLRRGLGRNTVRKSEFLSLLYSRCHALGIKR